MKWSQFKQYAISHKLSAILGRRLRVGPRLLEPVVGVRILPPQVRAQDTGNRGQNREQDSDK